MAEVKKIPSGLWQAIVVLPIKLPSGRPKRITKTHPLRRVVADWALQLESAIAAGTWLDPKASQVTLTEWRERWVASRIADNATAKKNESHWKNHVEPVWGGYPLSLISRGELKTWVHQMHTETCSSCRLRPGVRPASSRDRTLVLMKHKTPSGRDCSGTGKAPGLGAWTIQGAFAHLSGMLAAAVDEGLLPASPAAGMTLPKPSKKPVFFWTKTEASQILLQIGGSAALAVELDLYVGLRPGELFGLRQTYVDTDTWLIHVYGVATRTGWRPWPKSSKSFRAVPVPAHMRDRFLAHLLTLEPDDLVFPAPGGGLWDDRNFARRVFDPAVKAAGVRRGTVYDMRHTAASWLVQRGVSLVKVQHLLGHEKYSTTLIYAHLQPGAFSEVLDAWDDGGLDPRSTPPTSPRPHGLPEQQKDPVPGDPGNGA
jgi:integrase